MSSLENNEPEDRSMSYDYTADRKARHPNRPYKSPGIATWLSLFPGLGQIYVGYYQLGFSFVLVMAVTITILNLGLLGSFFGPLLAFFWVFNLIDANRRAQGYNRALDGLQEDGLPPEAALPGLKGNRPLGFFLVIAGVLIFLDLNFGISLQWLENWWPLALIGFGGWLIIKSRQDSD